MRKYAGLLDWMPIVRRVTSEALLRPQDLRKVEEQVAALPLGFGRGAFALERRLDLAEAGCDLLVCARDSRTLLDWCKAPPEMARLAALWHEALQSGIAHAWLDFDLSVEGAGSILMAGQLSPLLAGLAVMVSGGDRVAAARRLVEALQGLAELRHLGLMAARAGQPVRLSLQTDWEALPEVLRLTDRGHLVAAARGLNRALAPGRADLLLDLDLESTETSLEVPCYADGLDRYMEFCETSAAACPSLTRAVLASGGFCNVGSHPELWPDRLEAWQPYVEGSLVSTLFHQPMLLKLRLTPDGWDRPKIYILYTHVWTEMK